MTPNQPIHTGQGWMRPFHPPTAVSHPLSPSSACSQPHPGERLGAGPPWAGRGAVATPPHPGLPDLKQQGELALAPSQGCCTSAASCAASLPPQTALISICQQLVEGQTDTWPLQPSPFGPGTASPASLFSPPREVGSSRPGSCAPPGLPMPTRVHGESGGCTCLGCGSACGSGR